MVTGGGSGVGAATARALLGRGGSTRAAIDAARGAFGGLNGLVNRADVAPAIKVLGRKGSIRSTLSPRPCGST